MCYLKVEKYKCIKSLYKWAAGIIFYFFMNVIFFLYLAKITYFTYVILRSKSNEILTSYGSMFEYHVIKKYLSNHQLCFLE